jgi:hypothetical protein
LFAGAILAGSSIFLLSEVLTGGDYDKWLNLTCASSIIFVIICLLDLKFHPSPFIMPAIAGLYSRNFYLVVVALGLVLPIVTGILYSYEIRHDLLCITAVGSLIALLEYERLWIKAGQLAPLS